MTRACGLAVIGITAARRKAAEQIAAIAIAEALRGLIVQAMPMVERNARSIARFLPPQIDKLDLADAGYVALCEAAQKFDLSRGVPLDAYARRKVRGAMWETVRRRNFREMSHQEVIPELTNEFAGYTFEAEIYAADERTCPESMLEEKRRTATARAAMECLSAREKFVVEKYYDGNELRAIGALMGGLRKDSVCRIHRRALGKMQEHFRLRGIRAA